MTNTYVRLTNTDKDPYEVDRDQFLSLTGCSKVENSTIAFDNLAHGV